MTTLTPINPPSSAGTPPAGYTILNTAQAYDITTTATITPPITVCMIVNAINDPTQFARLRILHRENGVMVDRTILAPDSPAPDFGTRYICARSSSLSPFVAALGPAAAPTFSITGRVLTPDGRGVRNAVVSLIDSQGVRRTAATSSFGVYSFDTVRPGENYTMVIASKRYRFTPRNIVITDNASNVDFFGLE